MEFGRLSTTLKGQVVVELLISFAVFSLGVTSVWLLALDTLQNFSLAGDRIVALHLAAEGLEASRYIRDRNFGDLTAGPHGILLSGGQWVFSGTSDTVDNFIRTVTVTLSPGRADIISSVTWPSSIGQRDVSIFTRLTDWR